MNEGKPVEEPTIDEGNPVDRLAKAFHTSLKERWDPNWVEIPVAERFRTHFAVFSQLRQLQAKIVEIIPSDMEETA